ncbi:uncharacterized protein LOC115134706 isoform X2 [Oncorhynchus nerka]|uniref:uncharacterized protein LOC115134706 isoform X2 n=1 Tax=Oncorhynchus nerka TaxID=8023 RepID=UPI0031B84BB0
MARPTRAKNQLNYSDLMELDDDEDCACMKGPSSKKARVLVKEPQRDKGLHQSSKSFELHEVTSERGSNVNPSSQRWAAVKAKDQQRSILKVERISQIESGREDKDYQPTCIPQSCSPTPATSKPVSTQRKLADTPTLPVRSSPISPVGGRLLKWNPPEWNKPQLNPEFHHKVSGTRLATGIVPLSKGQTSAPHC